MAKVFMVTSRIPSAAHMVPASKIHSGTVRNAARNPSANAESVATEAGRRIKAIQERDELRIAMRIVHVGLAPVVDDLEGDVHDLVHPDAAALVGTARPEVRAEHDLDGIGVAGKRFDTACAGAVVTARDGVSGATVGNASDREYDRVDIVLRRLQATQYHRQPRLGSRRGPRGGVCGIEVKYGAERVADVDDIGIGGRGDAGGLCIGDARDGGAEQG